MHKIGKIDLALKTVQRDATEPQSWHALEDSIIGLTTQNCGLRSVKIKRGQVTVDVDGVTYGSPLQVPCIAHPIESGKLHFLGRPYADSYRLLDTDEFLDFAAECFKAAGMDDSLSFVTTLYDGARMTVARRLPEADFTDAHGHPVNSYVNLLNSVDGSWQVFANVSEIRTVCYNTATANIMEGGASSKHTSEALDAFIANFPMILADALTTHKGSANDYLTMASIPLRFSQAQDFFAALVGSAKLSTRAANIVDDGLLPLFLRGRGCYGESAADAYNAVTEYYTHNASAESNAPDGGADMRKREARALLLSPDLAETLEKGRKLRADYLARQ